AKATARESEATSGGLAELVGGLEAALGELGEREATAGQLCEVIEGDEDWTHLSRLSRRRHARLLQGIAALAPQLRERLPSAHQLGRVLGKVKDRPVRVGGEVKRVAARVLRGERLWRVETLASGLRLVGEREEEDDVDRAEREAIEQEPRWAS
ncbi:MAG: hypothetical protein JW751_30800, partial [Polyangiaceae bacterium]|nr:hypothetical protein [Polyangiaceae bacterium]